MLINVKIDWNYEEKLIWNIVKGSDKLWENIELWFSKWNILCIMICSEIMNWMYEPYDLIIMETWYGICSIDGIMINLIILLLW